MCCRTRCNTGSHVYWFLKANNHRGVGLPSPWHRQVCAPLITRMYAALTNYSWCMVGTEEYQVVGPTRTQDMQPQYTDCHTHGTQT